MYIEDIVYKLKNGYYKLVSKLLYSRLFYCLGAKSKIVQPLQLKNIRFISLGDRVTVNRFVFMMVETNEKKCLVPKLTIGNGTTIGNFNHIVAKDCVSIGDNVLTADKVFISDSYHGYEDIDEPICRQDVKSKGPVVIGDDCWIGENVCIISAKIGKHCVIAANSVVTSDIPDYCIAAGAPAKIIKQYNTETCKWEKILA